MDRKKWTHLVKMSWTPTGIEPMEQERERECVSLMQVSTRTEPFTDLSLSVAGADDNIRYVNTRLSCNSLVLHTDQPTAHVFVNRGWFWWILRKIFRQVNSV